MTSMYNVLIGTEAPAGGHPPGPAQRLVTAITTLAVTQAAHEGRVILLSLLAGFVSTLPAATGSGAMYEFMVAIVRTSGSYTINTTGTDVFKGLVQIAPNGSNVGLSESFGSTANKTFALNATTTGGLLIGDWIQCLDILSGVYAITGLLSGSGTLATPFSN